MLITFCSPFRGSDEAKNVVWALDSCREICMTGAVAFAPHLYFTRFLDDANPAERQRGIDGGVALMALADEVWFYLPPWRLTMSSGMKHEHAAAVRLGKTIVIISSHDEWEGHLNRIARLMSGAA